MAGVYLISDSHFGHANLINKIHGLDGKPLRDFDSLEAMNEHMVDAWNRTVTKRDVIYHLGDFAIGEKNIEFAGRLNGIKYLVMGNHDNHGAAKYLKHFRKLFGAAEIDNFLLTHIPVDSGSVSPRYRGNVHGHTHARQIGSWQHYCVAAENLHYIPRSIEWVKKQMEAP